MKCPFCAEDIQDTARLCRFCGAEKRSKNGVDDWQRPTTPPTTTTLAPTPAVRAKGHFTLRSAGFLLILSALFEGLALTTSVPLLGELREGGVAIVYHLIFVSVFLAMGLGLWNANWWGYRAVIIGTGIYLLDRFLYLLDSEGRAASIEALTRPYKEYIDVTVLQSAGQMISLVTLVVIACWIGFALYVHARRAYFQTPKR